MLKKASECFDTLSMNGLVSDISILSPFVLSYVEGLRAS